MSWGQAHVDTCIRHLGGMEAAVALLATGRLEARLGSHAAGLRAEVIAAVEAEIVRRSEMPNGSERRPFPAAVAATVDQLGGVDVARVRLRRAVEATDLGPVTAGDVQRFCEALVAGERVHLDDGTWRQRA